MVEGGARRIVAFATQGAGGNDEARLRALLERFPVEYFPFDRRDKRSAFRAVRNALRGADLAVMEGTGIAGGLALLASGVPYVVSSGDAVGPFVAARQPLLGPLFGIYERLLYGRAAGFIGWTPYLAGRALTFGARRAMTASGWAPFPEPGSSARARLGIAPDALVIGIVGSLDWNARVQYCYGLELVRAIEKVKRRDVVALIVGEGTGLSRLAGPRVILPGAVPRNEIPDYLASMDMASLPQSRDRLGSFRFTTKLSEYMAAGLPVVTGQLPLAYDLDSGWMWRVPGDAPWKAKYTDALAGLLDRMQPEELAEKRAAVPRKSPVFDRASQVARVTAMIGDILSEL
jgi:hypothetical protein